MTHAAGSIFPVQGRHVLVTGGAGYLGSLLVPALLEQGYSVSVLDKISFGEDALKPVMDHPNLRVYREDIARLDRLPDLFEDIDAVVHLASVSNDPTCDLDPNVSIGTNYLATTALARRARAEGVQQFLFASSCSVYGASSSRVLDEHSHAGPVTLYALTKLSSERELLELSSNDFRVTVLRLSTLFGLSPRMRFDLAVNAMTKRALQGKNIIVNGEGTQYRPFIHVRDAVAALLLALRADPAVVRGHVFNVGGDHLNFTIRRLAEEVQSAFPRTQIDYHDIHDDIRSYRVRFQKIHEQLGFAPQLSVRDAVREITDAASAGKLGTMEEEWYYNIAVMKRVHGAAGDSPWAAVSSPAVPNVSAAERL